MRSAIRRIFVVVGIGFVGVGLYQAIRDGRAFIPSAGSVVLVLVLAGISVAGGAASWSTLFSDAQSRPRLRLALIVSQVGKHLPLGGVAQVLGQAIFSVDETISRSRVSMSLLAHSLVQIAAASLVGASIALLSPFPLAVRVGSGALALVGFALHRRWLSAIVKTLAPKVGLGHLDLPSLIPGQAAIFRSLGLCLVPVIATSLAFGVLLSDIQPNVGIVNVVPVFSLAWLAGYVAVPVPAGIGVREAVLVAMLGYPIGVVIAAAISHRIASMAVEGVAAAIAWRMLSRVDTALQ